MIDYTKIKRAILYAFIILLIFTLFIIVARLAMGVSFLLCFFIFLKEKKVIYFLGFVIILFVIVLSNKYTIQRLAIEKGEPRIVIWKCAKEIVDQKTFNYFIGTFSSEKVDKDLIDCYNSEEVSNGPYWWIGKNNYNYNTHNQYIWFFVSYGLLGLSMFLGIFGVHFWNFLKNKNAYSFFFILIFSFQSLFENLLSRQLGIYLFLWFCYLFIIQTENTIQDEK
ncbi:O-antigen ligase family protein [uncultured Flavobacterium sp.]|uniref:O-antigen ligase family protein n=1 Tax=uncultured Flavobacterium sp. TaxID=165435 RepID=UPI003081507A